MRTFPLIFCLFCALPAAASTSTLTGTIRDASGSLFNGKVVFQLPVPATDTTTNSTIIPQPVECPLINGSFLANRCVLEDNQTLQPTGTFYLTWFYDSFGGLVSTANYVVTGATFDFGAAVPVAVTTSNITLLNPALRADFTVTARKGSGAGSYSSASTSYVDVDATNLSNTQTIPVGWKLLVSASGLIGTQTVADYASVSLKDGSTLAGTERTPFSSSLGATIGFHTAAVITGDGASHTIRLQYKAIAGAHAAVIENSTANASPVMTFLLVPSN